MFVRTLIVIVLLASAFPALGQDEANKPNTNWPGYREGDYVIHDYKFVSGESLGSFGAALSPQLPFAAGDSVQSKWPPITSVP